MSTTLKRSLGSFALALVLLRLTGHKSLSQLNYFDFLTANMVAGLLTTYATDPQQDIDILLAPMGIIAADLLANRVAVKSRQARLLLEGEPVIFIQNGRIIERNITRMHYNIDEVLAALRNKGINNPGDVEFAVLEIDGKISVLKKSQNRPLTPQDLNIPTQYEGLSSVIVSRGKIVLENLQKNNLSQEWLQNKLLEQGINDVSCVYVASLATDGSLYVGVKG